MGQKLSKEEARAQKEARKKQKQEVLTKKREARLKKHAVDCPHCGKSVLDHMTQCPYCKGALTPYYRPMDEGKRKKIKMATTIVGAVITVAIVVLIFVLKK